VREELAAARHADGDGLKVVARSQLSTIRL
jgi:hypothetical protein